MKIPKSCFIIIVLYSDVAEMVLNKCTTTNSTKKDVRPDSKEYEVTFDYIFIEDRDRALE